MPNRQTKETISTKQINTRIQELAHELASNYQGKNLVIVGIIKGCFIFLADLSRELWIQGLVDYEIDFMGISSYGSDTESSKNPQITKDLGIDIKNRHVLVVEDIVDTGYSLDALQRMLSQRKPASLKTLVLLSKQNRRQVKVNVDYIGFEIEGWIEGYGLDTDEKYRGRPNIVKVIS